MTNTPQVVRVRWSNGHVDSAPTWEALLDKVRLSQWHSWTEDEFRQVLGKRAMRWSSTPIVTAGSAEFFFTELQRALLVEILNDNDDEIEEV